MQTLRLSMALVAGLVLILLYTPLSAPFWIIGLLSPSSMMLAGFAPWLAGCVVLIALAGLALNGTSLTAKVVIVGLAATLAYGTPGVLNSAKESRANEAVARDVALTMPPAQLGVVGYWPTPGQGRHDLRGCGSGCLDLLLSGAATAYLVRDAKARQPDAGRALTDWGGASAETPARRFALVSDAAICAKTRLPIGAATDRVLQLRALAQQGWCITETPARLGDADTILVAGRLDGIGQARRDAFLRSELLRRTGQGFQTLGRRTEVSFSPYGPILTALPAREPVYGLPVGRPVPWLLDQVTRTGPDSGTDQPSPLVWFEDRVALARLATAPHLAALIAATPRRGGYLDTPVSP